MGTKADFYVGRGEKAEWLGSLAWDGHPGNFKALAKAKTVDQFRAAVDEAFKGRDDVTLQRDGWPWPWTDSHLTDYSYAFDDGKVYQTVYLRHETPCPNCTHGKCKAWVPLSDEPDTDDDGYAKKHVGVAEFPSMKGRAKVAAPGTSRSGVMAFRVRR